ncbi:MAG TPA: Gfo/Idh/MocA family oxidoreductase [Gaiellaceae bacterium]|nr:Gfo/Idh/MocA family oxidoreductase [Gaiellaceae bacterium]
MIIVDNTLRAREAEGRPIRVGLLGAGFMAQGLTNQIRNSVPGMELVAIYARKPEKAMEVFRYAGAEDSVLTGDLGELEDAARSGRPVVTEDAALLCQSEHVDAIMDVTGSVELGARVALEAFAHGKHFVAMNAELDATIGPILHRYANRDGVQFSACDGDEPGLQMNLYRWVRGLGLEPRVMGNVKGLQDPYRNPDTQRGFAEQWGQNPAMVTSFADGSKISFEQTIVANATGAKVLQRGMSRGVPFDGSPLDLPSLYDAEEVRAVGSIVDYTVGPAFVKIFCLAEHADPKQRHYLNLYKMGEGPLYPFWVPYHLPHFEAPSSIARVVLFADNVAPPVAGPQVEVCAVAKRDLRAGETLDEYGMFMTYGEAANAEEMSAGRYLPEGLVEGCSLLRDVAKDDVVTYDDVELPGGRVADRLRAEQYREFMGETWLDERMSAAV